MTWLTIRNDPCQLNKPSIERLAANYNPGENCGTDFEFFDREKKNILFLIQITDTMKIKLLLLLILATTISSCSKWGYVQLRYPSAPQAVFPENIKNIAIINRSLTPKESKNNAVLEAVLSGEVAGSDKLASDECIKAVFDGLNGFHDMRILYPAETHYTGTGTREMPQLLDWQLVKTICDSTGADALLVLETFDSNSDVLASTVTNTINSAISGNMQVPKPPSQIRMNVTSYWRLYHPGSKTIIDQYQSNSFLTFTGSGIVNIPPPEALPQTAYSAGQQYANRFLPSYYFVKRDMYKRGKGRYKSEFLAGFRKSEVANWDGAMETWKDIAGKASGKNAGKACLNIAVAYEVVGKTDEALIWAKKAYEDYGNKLARDYANILKNRLSYE